MSLVKKIVLFVVIFLASFIFYILCVQEVQHEFKNNPLINKNTINLFDNQNIYKITTTNAIVTKKDISTGMYTDGNYENFSVVFEIPNDDTNLVKLWNNNTPSIAFESKLQSTTEWIINNKYKVSMYYYNDKNVPTIFYENTWVGNNHVISHIQPLPLEAKGKNIYVKYESDLGKLLFFTNGNDIRFLYNYLTIR